MLIFRVFYIIDYSNISFFQDASFVPNGNANAPMAEGINGPEVAPRLNQQVDFPNTHTHTDKQRIWI